jgi:sulfur-oxidizing protein SoxY
MDQITLLHIPAHYVETVEVMRESAPGFRMTGSISLSEDPQIEFTHDPEAGPVRVRVTDGEGGVYERRFGLAGG